MRGKEEWNFYYHNNYFCLAHAFENLVKAVVFLRKMYLGANIHLYIKFREVSGVLETYINPNYCRFSELLP